MHVPDALQVGIWIASSGFKFMWCPPSELATATSGRVGDLGEKGLVICVRTAPHVLPHRSA